MIRTRQILQGKPYDPVKVILADPRHYLARHVQAAHGHCGQVVAYDPDPLPIEGGSHWISHWVVRLRFRREGQNRYTAMQRCRFRQDQHRTALPELGKLGVFGQIAPINLPDARRGFDPGMKAGRGCFFRQNLVPQGHQRRG